MAYNQTHRDEIDWECAWPLSGNSRVGILPSSILPRQREEYKDSPCCSLSNHWANRKIAGRYLCFDDPKHVIFLKVLTTLFVLLHRLDNQDLIFLHIALVDLAGAMGRFDANLNNEDRGPYANLRWPAQGSLKSWKPSKQPMCTTILDARSRAVQESQGC